jgi:hypothetical protein
MKRISYNWGFDPTLANEESTFIDIDALEEFSALYPKIDVSPYQEDNWKSNAGCPVYSIALLNIMKYWKRLTDWEEEGLTDKQKANRARLTGGVPTLHPQRRSWMLLNDELMKCVIETIRKAIKDNKPAVSLGTGLVPAGWRNGFPPGWPDADGSRGLLGVEMTEWVLPCKIKLMREKYGIEDKGLIGGTNWPSTYWNPPAPFSGGWVPGTSYELGGIEDWRQAARLGPKWPPPCKCPPIRPITILIGEPQARARAEGRWPNMHSHWVTVVPQSCDYNATFKPPPKGSTGWDRGDGGGVALDGWDNPAQLPGTYSPPAPTPALMPPPTYTITVNREGIVTSAAGGAGTPAGMVDHLKGYEVILTIC